MIKKITLFTSVTTIFKYFFLVLFFNSFLLFSQNRIPQQPENPSAPGGELVLGERSVLWIRGVDPATRTWNVPDENIAEAERLMKEYYTKISYGKATVSSFDITPVYDFTLINNDFRGPMSAAAEADGYDLSTYNMVIYNFDAAATIAGGASASGNGSGSMNLPAVVIRTGQYKGFIHEGLHTFGLGHAEGLDGGNDLFPGKTLGGVDPYHFLGSEFDAGLDADVPMYFKYSVGWLNEENIPLQPINPTSCTTHRIYEFANVSKENFREDRHYGVQYGDEFILSYMPESANSHFATRGGNLGVLLQWQPKQSEDITRLIDTKPQSLETERANDIYAPVADFWDAALEEGDELSFMGDIIKIVATGGSGQQQWVDIEICSCISISGDSDGDGVCDALDQCPGTDDTLDVDNDSIPDACDDCPNSITNDVNNNGVCDNLECLNGAEDNFEYGVNDNLLLVSTNDTTGQNWKSKWTLDGASAMQDVDRVSVESGSLTTPLITGVGNKLRFIQNTGGKTIIFRDLDNTIENGDTFWISYLFKANDRAGDFLVNGRRLAFGKFNSGGMGIYNDRTQTLPVENNRTYWLVARYKTTSSDTTIDLWVDPSPDTFDENNPTMSSTSSEVINRLEKIVIIQETGNKSDFEMDDLRLGCSPPAELSNCELVGLSCDDGNACTINDVYDENCNCYGTFADTDNDGICNAEDSEGESCILNSPCDDGNECTINDRVDEDCNCTGELNDSNNDKVCDIIECDIDAYEGFEYASGDFKETANGGVGFRSNWDIKVFNESNAVVSNPELDLNIVEGSLNYDNLLSFGNSLRIGLKNKEHVTISRNFDENILNTTAVIWSSYLLNVNAKGNSSLQMQLDNRRDLGVGKRRGEIFGIQNITIPKPVLLLNNTYWVVVQYVNKGAGVDVNVWINPTKENFDITSPNYSLFSNNRFSEVNSISFSTSSDRTEAIFELDEFRIGCNPPSPLLESNQNCTAENAVLQEIIVNNRKAIIGKAVIEVSQGDEVIISARSGQELINAPDLNTYTIIDQDGNAFQDNHTFTVDNTNTGFYTIRNQLGCEVQVIITTGIEPIPDADNDGVFDKDDNCPNTPNPDQADSNDNGIGDVCETPTDSDNDGVFDKYDNCPITPNPDQLDTDKDGIGDVCDLINDTDGDGVRDALDNCVNTANADQADVDKDGIGDVCDDTDNTDTDGDGVRDALDNCVNTANADQADVDKDGLGDVCDDVDNTDTDGDGVRDVIDNCVNIANADQADVDKDGLGDVCDDVDNTDTDGDGVRDVIDNCVNMANADQADVDKDGLGDVCDDTDNTDTDGDGVRDALDNCVNMANADQADVDKDGLGDVCDDVDNTDTDGDGVRDALDNCVNMANADQADVDKDGIGDVCDDVDNTDTDGDGVRDALDNCVNMANADQVDLDKDGIGDVCDDEDNTDTDGDGVRDALDNCVNTANSDQADLDKDGLGDICDDDNDVLMYPNPAIDVLNLSYDHNGDYAFMIHTLSGKRIKYAKNVDKIIISSLPEGVYLMTITNFEKKEKTTQKFIIRRK